MGSLLVSNNGKKCKWNNDLFFFDRYFQDYLSYLLPHRNSIRCFDCSVARNKIERHTYPNSNDVPNNSPANLQCLRPAESTSINLFRLLSFLFFYLFYSKRCLDLIPIVKIIIEHLEQQLIYLHKAHIAIERHHDFLEFNQSFNVQVNVLYLNYNFLWLTNWNLGDFVLYK